MDSVNAEIREHEQEIAEIDSRIAALNRDIALLYAEKQKHLSRVVRCKGVLTLVRRLPPEVLADIFQWCSAMDWNMAPIVLSRVSSAWFRASRFPRVWTSVYIDCEASNVLERTSFWLYMSQSAPLDIKLRASWPPTILNKVVDMVNSRVAQWSSVILDTANLETVDHFLARMPSTSGMQQLTVLEIATQGASFGMPDEVSLARLAEAFDGVNTLKTLRFTCNTLRPITALPSTIETLDITVNTIAITLESFVTSLVPIAGNLPSLKHLNIRVSVLQYELDQWPQGESVPRTPLTALETLSLRVPPDFNVLLDFIESPNLCNLRMRSSDSASIVHFQSGTALANFFGSTIPPPPIRLLELYDLDIPDEAFIACFSSLPRLQELRLHWSDVSDTAIQQLDAETNLCPNLQRLDLRWCSQLRGRVLVDVVKSRLERSSPGSAVVAPIEEVAMLNCAFVEERDVLDLATMTVCRLTLRSFEDPCRAFISVCGRYINDG